MLSPVLLGGVGDPLRYRYTSVPYRIDEEKS